MELLVVMHFPLLLLPLPMKLQQLVEQLAATNHLGCQTGWVDLMRLEEMRGKRREGRGRGRRVGR